MRKYFVILIGAIGILALMSVGVARLKGEPRYQGRSARSWGRDLTRPNRPLSVTIQALQEIGPGAVPQLCKLLNRRHSTLQTAYTRLVSKLPAPAAQWLPPPDLDPVNVRTRAAATLGKLGPCAASATRDLARALADPEAQVRSAAAVTLGRIGRKQPDAAIAALVGALKDSNIIVRQNACAALGEIGSAAESAIPMLAEFVARNDHDLKPFAVVALGQIQPGTSGALPPGSNRTRITLLQSERVHLGVAGKPEWQEFASHRPDTYRFDLRFNENKNESEYALLIRQRDVKFEWRIELNGRLLGKLQANESDLMHAVAVPSGALANGENVLSFIPPREIDDVMLGPVTLHSEPLAALGRDSMLSVRVVDAESDEPLPCRITIVDESGALAPVHAPAAQPLAVRTGVVYTSNGQAQLGLLPGQYTIFAGRGFEYSVSTQKVSLVRGATNSISMKIRREVDTRGLVACDTHIHTVTFSGHGDARIDERILALAGEGIELPIATEHNYHADYAEPARRLRVDPYFTPVTGNEVTTKKGHFNAFPIQLDAPVPDSKVEHWPTLIQAIRETPSVQVVILNHPRDLHSNFRPFAETNFNAITGENRRGFEFTFNAVELINSGALQSDLMRLYRDWFGLLNYGNRIAGAGGSDSHDVSRYIVGQGRTYVVADDTDPARINVAEACRSFREGRTSISMGLLTLMTVDKKFSAGDLATGLGDRIEVDVRVLGPSWSNADRLQLFANGSKIREEMIEFEKHVGRVLWRFPRPAHDVFLVAIASGPGLRAPFWPIPKPYQPSSLEWTPRVIGSSAPVWIDADGDGQFTPARGIARQLVQKTGTHLKSLVKELSGYDAAIAAQAASLARAAGHDISAPEISELLANSPESVRRGFKDYLDSEQPR